MTRSGYVDESEHLELYRANVERSIQGKRGQAFLRELAEALDAMPVKELIPNRLVVPSVGVCAIGAVCRARRLDVSEVDYYDPESVGNAVGISRIMAAEIEYMNDEWAGRRETPTERWTRMRKWVDDQINSL
jgi:hypothetical protein